MTQATQTQNYFNLTSDGIGFLNRPREVKSTKGNPYFACTISASRGSDGDKSRFDLRVVGGEAKELFSKLLENFPEFLDKDFKNHPKVVVGFRAGDIRPIVFESTNRQTGEKIATPSIDGRLLKFTFIKVNGEFWYKENKENQSNAETKPFPAEEQIKDEALADA